MKELLVLVLSCGENERSLCLEALRQQSFTDYDVIEIANLPNREAHTRLYSTVMSEGLRYRYFLKLDADMVFRHRDVLKGMLGAMKQDPTCDHATWHVLDFLSETRIRGIHLFSRRARWPKELPEVTVDPDPFIEGSRRAFSPEIESGVVHSPFPSPEQAFRFGLHRGSKAFPRRGLKIDPRNQIFQLELLRSIHAMFLRSRDPIRGLALLGAELARVDPGAAGDYKTSVAAQARFKEVEALGFGEVRTQLGQYWKRGLALDLTGRRIALKLGRLGG